jgi:hypothetical protein
VADHLSRRNRGQDDKEPIEDKMGDDHLYRILDKDTCTSRDVVINDVALSSLKTPEWSQLVFCDVFVTIFVWSLWWRHICSSVTKLVFSS